MTLKNFINSITGSDRIFTREDIGNMSPHEYTENEKAIYYQLNKIGVPPASHLANSSDVVFVSAYTRKDGTTVKAHYRSKFGRTSFLPEKEVGNSTSNSTSHTEDFDEFLQNPLPTFLNTILYPPADILPTGSYQDNEDSTMNSGRTEEEQDMIDQYKLFGQIGTEVINAMTDLIPDDWDFKPVITGITAPIQGLILQMSDYLAGAVDPESAGKEVEEQFKAKIEKAMNALGDCVDKMLSGDFKDIDWFETMKNMSVDEIASVIHPIAGSVASLVTDVAPALIDAVKNGKEGNKQQMIQGIMNAVTSGFSPISQLAGALGEKIGDLKDIGERNKAIQMYGDLKELSESKQRYEMLVSAELYAESNSLVSKIKTLADKFIKSTTHVYSQFKSVKSKIFDSDVNSNINDSKYNTPLPKADFSEYKKGSILKKINEQKNADRPDAKELMNISIVDPIKSPTSLEYDVVGPEFNNKLNKQFKLGSAQIDKKWPGVIYKEYSSLSFNLSNSSQLQAQVKENFINNQFKSDKIFVGLDEDKNLHYSIGHGTILNPKIENGYFKGVLFDKYDYKWDNTPLWKNNETTSLNNKAYALQRLGLIKNYYILVPIKFKW